MMPDGDTAAPSSGGSTLAGGQIIQRDDVVSLFGTPDHSEGSVNEPRPQVEHGFEFNEKWIYDRPRREPTRPRARVIYWQRYDFVGCVRIEQDGHVVPESVSDLLRRRGKENH
jgi:hypothetical protein